MQNSVETRITVVDKLTMQNGLQDRLQPSAACFGFKLSCVCCTCRCRSLRGCSRKISQCQLQVVHQWGDGISKGPQDLQKNSQGWTVGSVSFSRAKQWRKQYRHRVAHGETRHGLEAFFSRSSTLEAHRPFHQKHAEHDSNVQSSK